MKKNESSVTSTETEPDEKESTGAAFFYGTLFWAIAGSAVAWFAASEDSKIKVIRIGGLIIGITLLMGALTIWPKRKYFVVEMSVLAIIASLVLWRDGGQTWALTITFIVCTIDSILLLKMVIVGWLSHLANDDRAERGP